MNFVKKLVGLGGSEAENGSGGKSGKSKTGIKPSPSLHALNEQVQHDPQNARLALRRAEKLLVNGHDLDALDEFNRAVALDRCAETLLGRANAFNNTKQYFLAIEDMHAAIALEPDNGALYNCRGFAYMKTHREEMAQVDFARAIELHWKGAYESLAALRNTQRRFSDAIHFATMAIEAFPERRHGYRERAEAKLAKFQKFPEGLQPSHLDLLEEAVSDCSTVLRDTTDDYKSLTLRGQCLRLLGKRDEAIADFKLALAINPGFIKAQVGLHALQPEA